MIRTSAQFFPGRKSSKVNIKHLMDIVTNVFSDCAFCYYSCSGYYVDTKTFEVQVRRKRMIKRSGFLLKNFNFLSEPSSFTLLSLICILGSSEG